MKKVKNTVKFHNLYRNKEALNELEILIRDTTNLWYQNKHPRISKNEVIFVNAIKPSKCPYCGISEFVKCGKKENRIQIYLCKNCRKKFSSISQTIFDSHKIPISEWIEFLLNLLHLRSTYLSAVFNQNAITTGFYWFAKIFLVLENCQDDITLSNEVIIDEMFITKPKNEQLTSNKKYLRGISRNKNCIATGCSTKEIFIIDAKCSKLSSSAALKTYGKHILKGSCLTHDAEKAHNAIVEKLNLSSFVIDSSVLKNESDNTNPMNEINKIHMFIRKFFTAHKGLNKVDLQDVLNLCWFILTPSMNDEEKMNGS